MKLKINTRNIRKLTELFLKYKDKDRVMPYTDKVNNFGYNMTEV